MSEPLKPPPIVIAAQGIDDFKMRSGRESVPADWGKVCAYPPFQMFVREHGGRGTDALRMVHAWLENRDPGQVWSAYCIWFGKKGLWVAENPDGSLKR